MGEDVVVFVRLVVWVVGDDEVFLVVYVVFVV